MDNALFYGEVVDSRRILYTPSDFAKSCLFHLQEIGELQAQKPHISKRENLTSLLFFIVLSGSGTLTYDQKEYTLTAGDCVFLDCKKPYSHECSKDLWNLKWIHFYGPSAANIYEKYASRGGQPVFHPQSRERLVSLWNTLFDIASSEDYIRDMRINEGLTSFMTIFMEESWNPEQKQVSTKRINLLEVKNYLDEHASEKIALEDLAQHFFINKFYLTRIFKEQFGVSINTYLLQIRITKAKRLLRFSDKAIEEIGEECGITPLYYFSRVFKKIEGMSPSEYREIW